MLTYVKFNAWHRGTFQSYSCYYDQYYHHSATGNKWKTEGGSSENIDPNPSFFAYLTSEIQGNVNHF